MRARLPLRITLTSCAPAYKNGPVECSYEIHDADDLLVRVAGFTTMPENVEEVARYTVDRISQAFATPPNAPTMSEDVRTALAAARDPVDQTVTGNVSKGKKGSINV